MKIAIDYDDTFTKCPPLFSKFIRDAIALDHDVRFVTFRFEKGYNDGIELDAIELDIPIMYSDGKQKSTIWEADVWIDDSPVTIPNKEDLLNMYNGCLVNNE